MYYYLSKICVKISGQLDPYIKSYCISVRGSISNRRGLCIKNHDFHYAMLCYAMLFLLMADTKTLSLFVSAINKAN